MNRLVLPSQWCYVGGGLSWTGENSVTNVAALPLCIVVPAARLSWGGWIQREKEIWLVHSGTESCFFSSEAVFDATRCVCTSQPSSPWPGGTPFSCDASGKAGVAGSGDEVGKQWHEWEERMTPCFTLCGPQLVYGEREAVCRQHWLCSKGMSAFVCQYGYSWVKSVVFAMGTLGARGTATAPNRQRAASGCSPN